MQDLFYPSKIKVGFQKRDGTYTGMLSYITYFDNKGTLRKETSWNGWRNKDIEPLELENTPTSGFVLNKKVGGYDTGWNHRQTYCRVYDPRGYEFEITMENLLYILENTSSIKGKGLEGEFVYCWSGKDLVLVPSDTPDFKEIFRVNNIVKDKQYITAKNLIIGAEYLLKNGEKVVYMGVCNKDFGDGRAYRYHGYTNKHVFAQSKEYGTTKAIHINYHIYKSVGDNIVELLNEKATDLYVSFFEKMQTDSSFYSVDYTKNVFVPAVASDFEYSSGSLKSNWDGHFYYDASGVKCGYTTNYCYINKKQKIVKSYIFVEEERPPMYSWSKPTIEKNKVYTFYDTVEEFIAENKPYIKQTYLSNGQPYERAFKDDK